MLCPFSNNKYLVELKYPYKLLKNIFRKIADFVAENTKPLDNQGVLVLKGGLDGTVTNFSLFICN